MCTAILTGLMRAMRSRVVGRSPLTVREPPRGLARLNLREAWSHRELVLLFAWRDLKVRYQQTVIGAAWVVLQPLILMGVFTLIFGRFLRIDVGAGPRPLFYFSALVPWHYFAGALSGATASLVNQQSVITKVYFPRVLLPIAAVFPGLVDLCISTLMLIATAFALGVAPSPRLFALPLFVALALASALGAGLWLAMLNARFRDISHGIAFLVQIWFFASPMFYSASAVPEQWRTVWRLNPMVGVIEGFRWAAANQAPPDDMIFVSAGVAAAAILGGLFFFRSKEHLVADFI